MQVGAVSGLARSTWTGTDTLSWCYAHYSHLTGAQGFDEGFTRVLTDVTHLGPSDMHLKMVGVLAQDMNCVA